MKTLSFFLVLTLTVLLNLDSYAQSNLPVPVKDGTIYYENVVKVNENFSKADLFEKAKQWIAENFTSTRVYSPIQYENEKSGILIVNVGLGNVSPEKYNYLYENINCSLKIQVQNGKYKYTFTKFKSTIAITSENKTIRGDSDFDSIFDPRNKVGKGDLFTLDRINLMIQNIIKSLSRSLNEPVTDVF
ncbi:MAG: hypothetical protein ACD_77C00156G0007 [uncultured bacterium]|nr:MAG: hypothetical protein ACD_77C00156G0007 [uncultured bacterium]